jgi:hypothetical protein
VALKFVNLLMKNRFKSCVCVHTVMARILDSRQATIIPKIEIADTVVPIAKMTMFTLFSFENTETT